MNEIMESFVVNNISITIYEFYVLIHRYYGEGLGVTLEFRDIEELLKFFNIKGLNYLTDELLVDYVEFDG